MRPAPRHAAGAAALCLLVLLSGCDETAEVAEPPVRPVRTIAVSSTPQGTGATFSGRIEAADRAALAFRVGGRLAERTVEVGSVVEAGDPIARLEPQNEQNAVRASRAALVQAEAAFVRADNAFGRHRELLARGVTAQAYFEGVEQARTAAEAQVTAARARLAIAEDQLGFTLLDADAPGVVTAIGAEPGEIVAPGQMIARLAREGGRDAVFDVSAQTVGRLGPDALLEVALSEDPSITAVGRVREVAPQADPVTRTFRVRAGLDAPPAAMRLGVGVTGTIVAETSETMQVPLTALNEAGAGPAVWVVDVASGTVSLRKVEIARRDGGTAHVASGLSEGEVVVTAGAGVLREGQRVRIDGAQS